MPDANEIKKLHLQEVVLFAINYIPQADTRTLKLFLELVNAGGTFGAISQEQILKKMQQVLRYVPDASSASLLIVLDLLEIKSPQHLPLRSNGAGRFEAGQGVTPFGVPALLS